MKSKTKASPITVKINNLISGIFHYHAPDHIGHILTMIQRILQIFENILPFDEFNRILHLIKQISHLMVSVLTLAITVFASIAFRGFLSIIPILLGVVGGYIIACFAGLVDWSIVSNAPWFALPTIYTPTFDLGAILIILPAALVVIAEHIGHLIVTGNIVGSDLTKDPGLDRSIFGNGLSTIISGFFGSTPNTTYGENIGVLAITKVYSTWVIGGAAIFAILLSCFGKLAAAIQSIPTPVMLNPERCTKALASPGSSSTEIAAKLI